MSKWARIKNNSSRVTKMAEVGYHIMQIKLTQNSILKNQVNEDNRFWNDGVFGSKVH